MLKYMLDTNIAIYVIKRRPPEALATFNQHAGQLCISSIALAELMHGAEKSAKPDHNLRQVEGFTSRLTVLEYGNKAAAQIVAFSIFRQLIFNHAQSFRAGQQIKEAPGIGGLGVLRYSGLPVLGGAGTVTHESWPWSG